MTTTKLSTSVLPSPQVLLSYIGSGYAPGSLFGLRLINSPDDLDNDIIISVGNCRDIGNAENIDIVAPITKRLDAAWAPGSGSGWLDTGTVQPNATYHAFAIKNPSTGATDSICSASPVSPNLSAGWTALRRIGAVLTNASGTIRPFLQTGGWFYHLDEITDASNVAFGVAANFALTVPKGIKVIADFAAVPQASTGGAMSYLGVCDPDLGAATLASVVGKFTDINGSCQLQCITDNLARVNIFASVAGLISLFTRGWYDARDTYA